MVLYKFHYHFLAHQHKACRLKDIKKMKQRIATSQLVVNVF